MKNLFKAGGFVIIYTAGFSLTGIYSHSSPRASYMLIQKGFTQVTNMDMA
jgi:hypothetical protein